MIEPKKYSFHVKALGSEDDFIQMINCIYEKSPWLSDEDIEGILRFEENERIGPLNWFATQMG